MISVRNVILSGQRGPEKNLIATAAFNTPEIRADAAVDTVYKFTIRTLEGAPSAATLGVQFQAAIRTTNGLASTDNFTDKQPVWQTLNADRHRGLMPDGDWPTTLADETLATPVVFFRRIIGGFSHRLLITPSYTGGTTPAFVYSIENQVRY